MEGIGNFGGSNFGPLGLRDGNNGGGGGIDFGAVLDQLLPRAAPPRRASSTRTRSRAVPNSVTVDQPRAPPMWP